MLLVNSKAWKDLIRKLVNPSPPGRVIKRMMFVENLGFQVKNAIPDDPSTWMWVFGPDLHGLEPDTPFYTALRGGEKIEIVT